MQDIGRIHRKQWRDVVFRKFHRTHNEGTNHTVIYQEYLRDNIHQLEEGDSQADYLPDARAMLAAVDKKRTYLALLAIPFDPSANFGDLVKTVRSSTRYSCLKDSFYVRVHMYGTIMNDIRAFWGRNASWGMKTEETGPRSSAVDSDARLGDESGIEEVGSPDVTPRKRRKLDQEKSSTSTPAKSDCSVADKMAQRIRTPVVCWMLRAHKRQAGAGSTHHSSAGLAFDRPQRLLAPPWDVLGLGFREGRGQRPRNSEYLAVASGCPLPLG